MDKELVLNVLQEMQKALSSGISKLSDVKEARKINDRYTDNGDNTITDNLLKVVWIKDPSKVPGFEETMTFSSAEKTCSELQYAGKKDWRVPTIEELRSIVDYTRNDPAWDTNVFGGKHGGWYWTSTTCAWNAGAAWCVYFYDGYVGLYNNSTNSYVRPVRSI